MPTRRLKVVKGKAPITRRLLQMPGIRLPQKGPRLGEPIALSPLIRRAYILNQFQERDIRQTIEEMLRNLEGGDKLRTLLDILSQLPTPPQPPQPTRKEGEIYDPFI